MAAIRKKSAQTKPGKIPPTGSGGCIGGMCSPKYVHAYKAHPLQGTYELISLDGPGLFLAGYVTKQGGATGLTGVHLLIDGQKVVSENYVSARNTGLMQSNPFGLVVLDSILGSSVLQNMVFGWPVPLVFRKNLTVSVEVKETGVVQILARLIRGSL